MCCRVLSSGNSLSSSSPKSIASVSSAEFSCSWCPRRSQCRGWVYRALSPTPFCCAGAMDEEPPCEHREWVDWKRLRQKNGLQHFVCIHCGAKWKRATQARKGLEVCSSCSPTWLRVAPQPLATSVDAPCPQVHGRLPTCYNIKILKLNLLCLCPLLLSTPRMSELCSGRASIPFAFQAGIVQFPEDCRVGCLLLPPK